MLIIFATKAPKHKGSQSILNISRLINFATKTLRHQASQSILSATSSLCAFVAKKQVLLKH